MDSSFLSSLLHSQYIYFIVLAGTGAFLVFFGFAYGIVFDLILRHKLMKKGYFDTRKSYRTIHSTLFVPIRKNSLLGDSWVCLSLMGLGALLLTNAGWETLSEDSPFKNVFLRNIPGFLLLVFGLQKGKQRQFRIIGEIDWKYSRRKEELDQKAIKKGIGVKLPHETGDNPGELFAAVSFNETEDPGRDAQYMNRSLVPLVTVVVVHIIGIAGAWIYSYYDTSGEAELYKNAAKVGVVSMIIFTAYLGYIQYMLSTKK